MHCPAPTRAPGRQPRPTIRFPITTLALLLAATPGPQAAPATYVDMMRAKEAGKPNLILIVADDLGWGDLGAYGQQRIRTPHLDRLAGQGMRFTQAYAGSPLGPPSRAALLTGLHTGHGRIRGRGDRPLRRDDPTIAELLQSAGYKTAAIGTWTLGGDQSSGHPNVRGFDEWLGYLEPRHAQDYYPPFLWRNRQRYLLPENSGGHQGRYAPDLFIDATLNFIRSHARFPLFVYLATTLPRANTELGLLTGNGMQVPGPNPYAHHDWPDPERHKAAMISRLDSHIGQLLDLLDELDLARQTVIIFTSDNGPHAEGGVDPAFFQSTGELRGTKGSLHEGGVRVPFIVRWNGRIPPGKVSDQPFVFWDFLPTAAALAQTSPTTPIDGISLMATLLGQPQTQTHPFLYWELHEPCFQQAIRQGDWKAIRKGPGLALELYNLKSDPAENRDVAAHHPDVVSKLDALLAGARTESRDWPVTERTSE
jgi:arylsulfatase A-like enzyme